MLAGKPKPVAGPTLALNPFVLTAVKRLSFKESFTTLGVRAGLPRPLENHANPRSTVVRRPDAVLHGALS